MRQRLSLQLGGGGALPLLLRPQQLQQLRAVDGRGPPGAGAPAPAQRGRHGPPAAALAAPPSMITTLATVTNRAMPWA